MGNRYKKGAPDVIENVSLINSMAIGQATGRPTKGGRLETTARKDRIPEDRTSSTRSRNKIRN